MTASGLILEYLVAEQSALDRVLWYVFNIMQDCFIGNYRFAQAIILKQPQTL
jgi:hypothetical protein